MFKNSNQNKASLSQLIIGTKITLIFIVILVCGLFSFYYLPDIFVVDFMPYFSMGVSFLYIVLITRKYDMGTRENCCSYKGDLTELLIILHKFGFELVHESKTYMQLDLRRLFITPKSIFLIPEKKEIKILGDRELIEAMSKDIPKCEVMNSGQTALQR